MLNFKDLASSTKAITFSRPWPFGAKIFSVFITARDVLIAAEIAPDGAGVAGCGALAVDAGFDEVAPLLALPLVFDVVGAPAVLVAPADVAPDAGAGAGAGAGTSGGTP